MAESKQGSRILLGFLWVAETGLGYVGGLLVTNHLGRPVEFQCTTPVRPNRTQEILFGASLKPFVFAELIAKTLCDRISVKPDLVIVEQPELLNLSAECSIPVACLISDDHQELPDQVRVQIASQSVRIHARAQQDVDNLQEKIREISGDADLREPLQRVREALQETIKTSAVA